MNELERHEEAIRITEDAGVTVLVIDDDPTALDLFATTLKTRNNRVIAVSDPAAAIAAARDNDIDLVLSDVCMMPLDGLALCKQLRDVQPDLPIVFVTGQATMDLAIDAMRLGATDLLLKPVGRDQLRDVVARAARRRARWLPTEANGDALVETLRGASRSMRELRDVVARAAKTDASVLIYGETGTGKELVARALHEGSPRRDKPFVSLNCAAVPLNLLESELFGHVQGAFTDAQKARVGLFAAARGGTVFLDELGEMPLTMQAKLLRALQERLVRPVGGDVEIPIDVRVIAATNRDLEQEIVAGSFRKDLYYRINVLRIDLPALRDRGGDVIELAEHFLRELRREGQSTFTISPRAREKLEQYPWPGNVRELQNALDRAAALARYDVIESEDLPATVRGYRASTVAALTSHETDEVITLETVELEYIGHVLRLLRGNKSRTAELLGIDRRTLYRKLERLQAKAT